MAETRRGPRTRYRVAAATLLAVLVADTFVWFVACRRLETGVRETMEAAGWTLTSSATQWGGWPVAAEITLADSALRTGPDVIPPLVWTARRTTLRLVAWRPTILTVSPAGAQTLAIGAAPPVPFAAQTLAATIDLTAHDPVRLAAAALEIAAPDGPVRMDSATLLLLPDGVSVDLEGVTLPGRAGQPMTPPIDTLRFDGQIAPPIEPQPTASESARIWRTHGGTLTLSAASLRWAALAATGRATLTLDQSLQPAITGQITATGLATVIEQLAQTGALTRSAATAAQGMLAILAAPTGGGPVTLPVALRDGIVSLARIPLLRLAPLQWD